MLKMITPEEINKFSLNKAESYKKEIVARHTELLGLKKVGGKEWTKELQIELDNLAVHIIDVDEIIEKKHAEQPKVKPGTEAMIHLKIARGRRFNPTTGKEESKPFVQLFTFSEWQLFKKNFSRLGFIIMDVLHDPYNDAAQFITK